MGTKGELADERGVSSATVERGDRVEQRHLLFGVRGRQPLRRKDVGALTSPGVSAVLAQDERSCRPRIHQQHAVAGRPVING
jgi:hypothetical protein